MVKSNNKNNLVNKNNCFSKLYRYENYTPSPTILTIPKVFYSKSSSTQDILTSLKTDLKMLEDYKNLKVIRRFIVFQRHYFEFINMFLFVLLIDLVRIYILDENKDVINEVMNNYFQMSTH